MNDLERNIVEQLVELSYGKPEKLSKPITYAISDGIYCIKKTQFGHVTTKVDSVPYVEPLKEEIHIEFGKAPYELFLQAYSFFKDVCKETGNEAALVLYYDKFNEVYEWHCPEQTVSKASVKFANDPIYVYRQKDPSRHVKICEAHSHNTMGAFYSGTDNEDEKFEGFFMVFGRLDTDNPEVLASFVGSGKRVITSIFDLFDKPTLMYGNKLVEVNEPIFVEISYPKDWHDKLSEYVSKSYNDLSILKKYESGSSFVLDSNYSDKYNDVAFELLEDEIVDYITEVHYDDIMDEAIKHYNDKEYMSTYIGTIVEKFCKANNIDVKNIDMKYIVDSISVFVIGFDKEYYRW